VGVIGCVPASDCDNFDCRAGALGHQYFLCAGVGFCGGAGPDAFWIYPVECYHPVQPAAGAVAGFDAAGAQLAIG